MKPDQTSIPQTGGAQRKAPKFPNVKWGVLVWILVLAIFGGFLWHWHSKKTDAEQASALSPFSRQQDPAFDAKGPKSGLLDLAAVNASLRARGQRTDNLAGSYVGNEDHVAAYTGPVNSWSQAATAAAEKAAKAQDVYFGQDADTALRSADTQGTGKGSLDTAAMHAKANVARTATARPSDIDWQATGVDISALDKALQQFAPRANLKRKSTAAVQAELNQTVEMSFLAAGSDDLMRKKQIASAGFMGADVSQNKEVVTLAKNDMVFSGTETGNSYQAATKQLAAQEQCGALTRQIKEKLTAQLPQVRDLIRSIRAQVPDSCAKLAAWKNSLMQVRIQCQSIRGQLLQLKNTCGMILTKDGTCEAVYLESYAADLSEICADLSAAQGASPRENGKIAQLNAALLETTKNFDVGQLHNSFNIHVDGIVGGNDFFPETENTGLQQQG